MTIEAATLRRVIVSLVADELAKFRAKSVPVHEAMSWSDDLSLSESGVGFDSLGLLNVASRANQFFHLHEVGIEDYLLMEPTLGSWQAIIKKALSTSFTKLTFQTSGSTGTPKSCTQERHWLEKDASAVGAILQRPTRILSLVPPHHIYGFIYSALMPGILQIPVLDIRSSSPGVLVKDLREGDVIVATPHLWRYLLTSIKAFPSGVMGLTSTAPMPADLSKELRTAGLARLIEIYGSTETNGVGWRDDPASGFTIFDWWTRSDKASELVRQNEDGTAATFELMDALKFDETGRFVPDGRVDHAIQIAGTNVFPGHIAQTLCTVDGVSACKIRPFSPSGDPANQRLKAFVVAAPGANVIDLEQSLRKFATDKLATAERPVSYTFGSSLPVTDTGKSMDWDV
ncbi:MAG: 4-coumarate--CoA ligase [Rhizobiaceae bacterium]